MKKIFLITIYCALTSTFISAQSVGINTNTPHTSAILDVKSNTTGSNNNSNGFGALYSNTSGDSNTANGSLAFNFNTTGSYNTANKRT